MLLKQQNNRLILSNDDKLVIINVQNEKLDVIHLPDAVIPPNLTKGQEDVLKAENRYVSSLALSKCGRFLLIATQNKQIIVFDNDFNVIKNMTINRAASRATFTTSNEILIADKTGDAYLAKMMDDKEPELLLGHLSMLLDILVTECDKYVITSDRDEKIRVSYFPNAYNILSYCLGHREFVTQVEIVNDVLVSSSGDGTIRCWDYKTGSELQCINVNDCVKDSTILDVFCNKMNTENVDVRALPILHMEIHTVSKTRFIIAAQLLNVNAIEAFEVNLQEEKLTHRHLQSIAPGRQIMCFSLSNFLYVLTDNGLLCYKFINDLFTLEENQCLNDLYKNNESVFKNSNCNDNVSVLYKRKFDNVQEYLERKKLRLEAK